MLTLALARPQPQPSPSLKPSPSPSPSPRRDQEKRSELLERWVEGPSLSAEGKLVMPEVRSRNGENSRAVGLAWKALNREEKQRWEAESQKDLKRYQAECAQAGVEPKRFPWGRAPETSPPGCPTHPRGDEPKTAPPPKN